MSASAILKLQAAGFSVEQVTALADLIDTQAASKSDLLEVEHRLDSKISDVKADITGIKAEQGLLKWMLGFVLAFQVAIFVKMVVH